MKKLKVSLMTASLLCLLSVGTALAHGSKIVKEHVTFSDNVMVNNTLVKKGDYLVKFDSQTSMVRILDQNNKVVAEANATLQMNEKKAPHDVLYLTSTPAGEKLQAMKLGGQREEIIISDTVASTNETSLFIIGATTVDLADLNAADVETAVVDVIDFER
jgi:hypothetical protein